MEKSRYAPYQVLFLDSRNSSYSILAEAYLNWAGQNRFVAHSAGWSFSGSIDPLAIEVLGEHRINPSRYRSKSWDRFVGRYAPAMDFIFLVCAPAGPAPECTWPGDPLISQWDIPESAPLQGEVAERRRALVRAFAALTERINKLLDLKIGELDRPALRTALDRIGRGSA